jgi:hypothetical protein
LPDKLSVCYITLGKKSLPGINIKAYSGGSITVPLNSCLTCLDYPVLQIKTKFVSCHPAGSNPAKQKFNSTVLPERARSLKKKNHPIFGNVAKTIAKLQKLKLKVENCCIKMFLNVKISTTNCVLKLLI